MKDNDIKTVKDDEMNIDIEIIADNENITDDENLIDNENLINNEKKNKSNNKDRDKDKKTRKKVSKFIFIGILLCIANLVIAGIVGYNVNKLLPTKYMIAFAAGVVVVNLLLVVASRRLWSGIIMGLISIAISAGLLYGLDVLTTVEKAIDEITIDEKEEPQIITEMVIVVLNDSEIHQISDLSEFIIGYVNDVDYDYANKLMGEINQSIGGTANYIAFSTKVAMAEALYAKTVDAIILNKAYISMMEEMEGYEDFTTRTKTVYTKEIVEFIEIVEKKESNLEKFVVYISGLDMFGHIGVRTRSDVNILAVVNTKTRHIQLIHTPRDYYIPHLVSKGQPDKLTHAALYGVDSSIYALEKLYGIQIDYYVKMNFSGFEGIIDALGGIDVYSEFDFTVEPIKHYVVGMNHLTGLEALAFARERKSFPTGDLQRGKHQMEVIKATINKLTSAEMLSKYSAVLEKFSWCIETDMSSDNIYTLVREQLATTKAWTFDSFTVTGTSASADTFSSPGYITYVMEPNMNSVASAKKLIEQVLAEE